MTDVCRRAPTARPFHSSIFHCRHRHQPAASGSPLTAIGSTAASLGRPYDDGFTDGGFLRYRYRGADPNHRDNVGLRTALQRQTPLIYLHGIVQGLYEPAWPVFIVEDHPEALTFIVAIDAQVDVPAAWQANDPAALAARRQYVTAVVRQRLHQRGFRERVLRAYQQCCAICRLRHDELLEAANLLPDGHPLGEPVIPNGLALCKLHHAAFDAYIIGVTPDLEVTVRRA